MKIKKATKASKAQPIAVGQAVIIRTVTHFFAGRLMAETDRWLILDDAAWIADSGRWADALKSGSLSEVEPYPGRCQVAVGAVVDMAPWAHALPREQR